MSEKIENLLKKPDSDELFDEIDKLAGKSHQKNSNILDILFSGFVIRKA